MLLTRRVPLAPTPDELRARIAGDDAGVEILDLGEGFYELVGEVDSRGRAERIERAVESAEGVVGVVNRLWIV
ncbi:MAG: hypothetical protein R3E98_03410 [Gemmatimonadota bacterium]|nr:hypothetical protein [Gemmatimonadota bacterium]